jgi:hypothetical protein
MTVTGQGEFAAAFLLSLFAWGLPGRMSAGRQSRTLALAALFGATLALAGCSSQIADLPLVGTPADAPARPKEPGAYLPVNDLPPNRDEATMDAKERARIQAELIAARDRQAVVTQGVGAQGKDAAK